MLRWTLRLAQTPQASVGWATWDTLCHGVRKPAINQITVYCIRTLFNKPFSDWLDAWDGDLTLFRLLLLQSPGRERWSSLIVPPWTKAVSWCERVVLVPEITMIDTNHTHANTHIHKCCLKQTYLGGPEAKPGSSNMSSLEREEDLTPTGVSCSITCISAITEWDTALQTIKVTSYQPH